MLYLQIIPDLNFPRHLKCTPPRHYFSNIKFQGGGRLDQPAYRLGTRCRIIVAVTDDRFGCYRTLYSREGRRLGYIFWDKDVVDSDSDI